MNGTSQEDGLAPISGERGRPHQSGLDAPAERARGTSLDGQRERACLHLAADDLLDRLPSISDAEPVTARGQRIAIFGDLPCRWIPSAGLHARDQFGCDAISFDGKRMICVVSINSLDEGSDSSFPFLGRPCSENLDHGSTKRFPQRLHSPDNGRGLRRERFEKPVAERREFVFADLVSASRTSAIFSPAGGTAPSPLRPWRSKRFISRLTLRRVEHPSGRRASAVYPPVLFVLGFAPA